MFVMQLLVVLVPHIKVGAPTVEPFRILRLRETMEYNQRKFIVVEFLVLPYAGIDKFVVVPDLWLIVRKPVNQNAFVSYPDNDHEVVNRVKRQEEYNDQWRFYTAKIRHVSETYEGAENWIANNNCIDKEEVITKRNYQFRVKKRVRFNPYIYQALSTDQLYYQGKETNDLVSKFESMAVTCLEYQKTTT